MLKRIFKLPLTVANQIAAGEVIERPASIVKELLENAFDAKATTIDIEISFGGLNQVKISDNGVGILAEDLPLAIAPHATSKISELQDLYSLTTLGFRGEALASIASITRLTISSKPANQTHAMQLICKESSYDLIPCARTQGTTIDACDIFYNAPVRKKFLKSEENEFQAIDLIVKRFALSAPSIAIKLSHNGKLKLNLPAALEKAACFKRVGKLFGKPFIDEAIPITATHAICSLQGWVSNTNYQRSQNDKLWVYINGRAVKDKLIHHAIRQAYDDLLYPGRHPVGLLYLTINPLEVDVNVHPTKHEVRFQQPRLIHDFIYSELWQALRKNQTPIELKINDKEPPVYNYTLPAKSFLKKSEATAPFSWLPLHERFVLLLLDQPYLLDLLKLQQQWLGVKLQQMPLPLAKRTLLVPIHITFFPLSTHVLLEMTQLLKQVGIEFEVEAALTLTIRSLPLLVPHLNIQAFFIAFFAAFPLSVEGVLNLLIENQTLTAQHLTEDQYQELFTYFSNCCNNGKTYTFSKQLTKENCQDLLNV